MKIDELITNYNFNALPREIVDTIRSSCGTFLQSTDTPLMKGLHSSLPSSKVKVRFHKRQDNFVEVFNEALFQKVNTPNIHQRCVFANGPTSFKVEMNTVPHYIFPIDGYRFLYNDRVTDVNEEFRQVMSELKSELKSVEQATDIIRDLLFHTYTSSDLDRGIVEGYEIIIYNIPYYFAINAKSFPVYEQLLTTLRGSNV